MRREEKDLPKTLPRPLAVALLSIAGAALAAPIASAGDWPQYAGPNLDRTTDERIGVTRWPSAGPKQLWRRPTPTGHSSFAVAAGRAYTLVSREGPDGGRQEVCLALDADTGKKVWEHPLGSGEYGHDGGNAGARNNRGGDGPRSTPTVDGGRVYVIDADINLYAINAADGKTVWKKDIVGDFGGRNIKWKNAASPLIDGDLLYLAGGGAGQSLIAFDKRSGEVAWKGFDETMTHATPVAATIHGVRQVIFFLKSGLLSVDARTGKELWRVDYSFAVSTAASPVVSGDIVYCSAGYGVGAGAFRVKRSGGKLSTELLWRKRNQLQNHWSTPLVLDGHLYGMFSFKKYGTGPVMCVELATGEEKWSKNGFGPGNVVLAGDHLVALSDDGQVVLIEADPNAYRELARADVLEGKCWTTPVVANGRIYARSTEEGVCLLVSP